MNQTRYQSFSVSGWRGKVEADAAARWLVEQDPLAAVLAAPMQIVAERRSTRTLRATDPRGDTLYVKHITAQNDTATGPGWHPVLSIKWMLRPSRALRTLKISRRMASLGFHCPRVMLAARRYSSQGAEDLLITHAAPGVTLFHALNREQPERVLQALDLVAQEAARMHRARLLHGDLVPGNVLVDLDGQTVTFLDNERTLHWPVPLMTWQRARNLGQMVRRLLVVSEARMARRFLVAYLAAAGYAPRHARQLRHDVLTSARRRLARSPRPAPFKRARHPISEARRL